MNARVEAAAKASEAYAEAWCADFEGVLALDERTREHMVGLGQAAIAASDAVMFDDAAIERAARESWNAIADGAEEFDELTRYERDLHTATVRAVIAALKGDA
jgi:hypothetical protein